MFAFRCGETVYDGDGGATSGEWTRSTNSFRRDSAMSERPEPKPRPDRPSSLWPVALLVMAAIVADLVWLGRSALAIATRESTAAAATAPLGLPWPRGSRGGTGPGSPAPDADVLHARQRMVHDQSVQRHSRVVHPLRMRHAP